MKNMLKKFKNYVMKKFTDYQKEQYRGTIKQIMKVRGLRTISFTNYNKWSGTNPLELADVHSCKLDLQDGYLNLFDQFNMKIEDASTSLYRDVYNKVNEILNRENDIPYKVKRNILVKINR